MRVLLTANASYAPPRGGATRSNLIWLERLAQSGHECRVICGPRGEGAPMLSNTAVTIDAVADPARRLKILREEIEGRRPDRVLVSSEDLSHTLLREAYHAASDRLVYLAHTPQFFPFGPESWNPDRQATDMIRAAAGIVAIVPSMADYVERWIGKRPTVIHPPIYGSTLPKMYRNFDRGRVVMLNPSAVKGLPIFLAAAERLPQYRFGALPGWATTEEDRRAISNIPNVEMLAHAPNIDDILSEASVLMMPSLWHEGFGLIVMEALSRGIPVVSSDSGGLRDAKAGTGYVISVKMIQRYESVFDEHAMPKAIIPDNPIEPWVDALGELLNNREAYEREARASRNAAEEFIRAVDPDAIVPFLSNLELQRGARLEERHRPDTLSPERRALLLDWLRKRKAAG